MRSYRLFVAVFAAVCMGFSAFGEEWTTDRSTPLEVGEDYEIEVADGKTVTMSGTISGAGKITKKGLGNLIVISANGGFTGGFTIDQGFLIASNATALGTAPVTILGQYTGHTGHSCLGLWGVGKDDKTIITYANAVNLTGNSTLEYPALVVYGQNAVLTGKITAAKDFTFYEDHDSTKAIYKYYSGRADYVTSLTFGEIEAGGLVQNDGWTRWNFAGKLKATAFSSLNNRAWNLLESTNRKPIYDFRSLVDVQAITNYTRDILVSANSITNGPTYVNLAVQIDSRAKFQLRGNDVKLAWISMNYKYTPESMTEASFWNENSYSYATLTLDGGKALGDETPKTRSSAAMLREKLNLTIDAFEGFTQIVSNRTHTMSGTINVKKGALEIGGAAKFTDLPTIVVGAEGSLKLCTTTTNAFAKVNSLTVNGRFESTSVEPFNESVSIAGTFGSNSYIDLHGGTLILASCTFGGTPVSDVTLTHAEYPDNIAEGTQIIVGGAACVYTDTDMTAQGDWDAFVFANCSNVVRVAQTGTGKITKRGTGTLVFLTENSYSGGTVIEKGIVRVETNNVFGTGLVTILGQRAGYTGQCRIDMIGCPKQNNAVTFRTTITNDIHITGNTTPDYPFIVGYYNACRALGKITANGDFCFLEDDATSRALSPAGYYAIYSLVTSLTFGEVEAAGKLRHDGWATFDFNGTASFGGCYVNSYRSGSNRNTRYNFKGATSFGAVTNQLRTMTFSGGLTVPGVIYGLADGGGNGVGDLLVSGPEQFVGGFTDPARTAADTKRSYNATSATTLTIIGVNPDVPTELTTHYAFIGKLSLVLDASDNFTQIFSNRTSSMSGSITVKKGTFKIGGTAIFANATGLDVRSGATFVNESTEAGALAGLKNLALETGATYDLNLPEGTELTLETLTLDGVKQAPGYGYTHENNPLIPEGVTINVTALQPATTVAVWTGAAGDGKMSTMGNWTVGGEIPTSLDLTSGTTTVSIEGGTEMIPDVEGIHVHSITNNRTSGASVPVFYLGAADKTLYVDGAIVSIQKARLGLRGTIAGAKGVMQPFDAVAKGPCVVYAESGNDNQQVLHFSGVMLKKPIYLHTTHNKPYWGDANTTNLILGAIRVGGAANNSPYVDANGVVEIAGAYTQVNRPWKNGAGTLKFSTTPVSIVQGYSINGGIMELACPSNAFGAYGENPNETTLNRGIRLGNAGTCLKFSCNQAIKDDDKGQLEIKGTGANSKVDFGATTQRFSRVYGVNTGNNSAMTGVYPAMLEVKGGTAWTASKYFVGLTNQVQIAGGLGFHYLGNGPANSKYGAPAGADDTYLLTNKAFSTCGNLEVSGGTLELAADASWCNGTNFIARGTGKLKFNAAGQVGSNIAVFHFADDGKVEIPAGVTLRISAAEVGGTSVDDGEYTKDSTGTMANRIEGEGALKIGRKGTTLILF